MEIKYFVGIKFAKSSKSYFFGTDIDGLQIGDKVVADSIRGIQIGTVTEEPKSIQEYKSQLELKEIVRKATNDDIFIYQENAKITMTFLFTKKMQKGLRTPLKLQFKRLKSSI